MRKKTSDLISSVGEIIRRNVRWLLRLTALLMCQNSHGIDLIPLFELKSLTRGELDYTITIYPNGKVYFHGNNAAVVGDRYGEITSDQARELAVAFLSMPFDVLKGKDENFEIKKDNFGTWTDVITYKDEYISMSIEDIIFFLYLEKKSIN